MNTTETAIAYHMHCVKKLLPIANVGTALRSLGYTPTDAEVRELTASSPKELTLNDFQNVLNKILAIEAEGDFVDCFRVFDGDTSGRLAGNITSSSFLFLFVVGMTEK